VGRSVYTRPFFSARSSSRFTRLRTTWLSSSVETSWRSSCAMLPHTAWLGAPAALPSTRAMYSFSCCSSSVIASTIMTGRLPSLVAPPASVDRRPVVEAVWPQHLLRDEDFHRAAQLLERVVAPLNRQPPGDPLERVARAGMRGAIPRNLAGQLSRR